VNAVPDFHQDRLVGKRNLVVRLGRERAVHLYLGLAWGGLAIVALGVTFGVFPGAALATLAAAPFIVVSARRALKYHSKPREFVPAMRAMVLAYLVATGLFTLAVLAQGF